MALFGLVFLLVALVLMGIGFAVGLVGIICAAVLIGLGVISSSVVIGLRSGRPTAGIRAFLVQSGVLLGAPAGAFCAWLAQSFFAAYGGGSVILIYGALGGAVAGIVVAVMLDLVTRRLHLWASGQLFASVLPPVGPSSKPRAVAPSASTEERPAPDPFVVRTGYELSYRDFVRLVSSSPEREHSAPLLRQWFGYEIERSGDGFTIRDRGGIALDPASIHEAIQADRSRQYDFYQTAMSLWR